MQLPTIETPSPLSTSDIGLASRLALISRTGEQERDRLRASVLGYDQRSGVAGPAEVVSVNHNLVDELRYLSTAVTYLEAATNR